MRALIRCNTPCNRAHTSALRNGKYETINMHTCFILYHSKSSIPLFPQTVRKAIKCLDSQSAKLDFPVDSRLRGNDGGSGDGAARGRHTGFKAVSTGLGTVSRHCRLDPQSRGVLARPSFPRRRESTGWTRGGRHTGFKAVSTGPGRQQANTNLQNPLSLDGRGPKPVPVPDTGARVKTMHQHHPVIADQVRNDSRFCKGL